jgi:hypothetical protein
MKKELFTYRFKVAVWTASGTIKTKDVKQKAKNFDDAYDKVSKRYPNAYDITSHAEYFLPATD